MIWEAYTHKNLKKPIQTQKDHFPPDLSTILYPGSDLDSHVTVLFLVNGRIGTYENPGSFQVSPRAKQYQTKSPARSANSPCTAISFKDAPKPEGRRRAPTDAAAGTLTDVGHGHAVVDFFKTDFLPPGMTRATPEVPGWSGNTLVVLLIDN